MLAGQRLVLVCAVFIGAVNTPQTESVLSKHLLAKQLHPLPFMDHSKLCLV